MDIFLTFARRLTFLVVLLLVCVPAHAVSGGAFPDSGSASSACQEESASRAQHATITYNCVLTTKADGSGYYYLAGSFGELFFTFPPRVCSVSDPPRYGVVEVSSENTVHGCDGQCDYAMTSGTQTSNGLGQSAMVGTWTPTGQKCNTVTEGLGDSAPPPPNVCAHGSCMNAGTGDVCSKDSAGNSMCVDGPTATGPGGCSGTADGAICAGPKPPLPSPPQLSQITDPATEITNSDHYTKETTTPGGTLPVVTPIIVNTYGVGGALQSPTSSGQQAGDKGPAPSSSTGSPQGGYAGGGDCNSPPACTGDPVMCGVGRQQWIAMCQQHKDADKLYQAVAGDGTAPDPADPPSTSGFASSLWNTPGQGSGDPIGDAANQGNYDLSGLGFSTTCPLHDMTVPLPDGKSFDIKFSKGCELGGWLKAIIIAFALFAAAKITAGGTG